MKNRAVIIGAGTYGQVYAEYLKDQYELVGFIDDNPDLKDKSFVGIKVIGNFDYLLENIDKNTNIFVPIGDNQIRVDLLKRLNKQNFKTPSFIHQDAYIHKSVKLGKAVYILPKTNIMPLTDIGDYTMISMAVNIAHHNKISSGCFFSQGSNIGASIKFGNQVFCGIGATIMTGVEEIGKSCTIGAGAVIIRDVPDGATVVGNPGRVIKAR